MILFIYVGAMSQELRPIRRGCGVFTIHCVLPCDGIHPILLEMNIPKQGPKMDKLTDMFESKGGRNFDFANPCALK